MVPNIPTLKIHTLAGVVAAIKSGFTESKLEGSPKSVIHIVNHETVDVLEVACDEWGRFKIHLHAAIGDTRARFTYGKWYRSEDFIIELQTSFVQTDNRDRLLQMASALRSTSELSTSDDGIGQQVTASAGVHVVKRADVPNPIALRPYRTFIDVGQPESSFVFRIRGGKGEEPTCALFEADGGHWKLDAMANIAKFFQDAIPEMAVIV
jgi:hypothetical protein